MDLSQANVVVLVFVMDDCDACDEYMPIFQQIAAPYRQAGIPVLIYDVGDDKNVGVQQLADRFGIQATPTTIVARRGPGFIKSEGAGDATEIKSLMDAALRVQRGW